VRIPALVPTILPGVIKRIKKIKNREEFLKTRKTGATDKNENGLKNKARSSR